MSNLILALHSLSPLTAEASDHLTAVTSNRTFSKGDLILRNGKVCQQLYYLQKGLVKLFFYKDDKEFIMRFFHENSIFTGLDSYITQTSSLYSIEALETTTVSCIAYTYMEQLCKKHHSIETAFRKFVSTASVNMMNRISEMLEENGTERYNNFVSDNKDLMQRISLGDLAGYLGITQVSLSRIRARKWLFIICKKTAHALAATLP